MKKTAVFVGSFDPFTIGHDSIARRAADLFDHLVIGVVGDNVNKPRLQPAEERAAAIRALYEGDDRIEVRTYFGLTVDLAREVGAQYIVKGVRSAADMESERQQADINKQIGGVETVLLLAEPQLQSVSSSVVRELQHFGRDISAFLPKSKK